MAFISDDQDPLSTVPSDKGTLYARFILQSPRRESQHVYRVVRVLQLQARRKPKGLADARHFVVVNYPHLGILALGQGNAWRQSPMLGAKMH